MSQSRPKSAQTPVDLWEGPEKETGKRKEKEGK